MPEIKRADVMGGDIKRRLGEIFVDGFGKHFAFFSKDKNTLAAAFEHMFVLDKFYAALENGRVVGMAACTNGTGFAVEPDKKELRRHLGFLKGSLAYLLFRRELRKPPVEIGERKASIEFVAVDTACRGKGVAAAIMNHFFGFPEYDEYVLEVADTNTAAVNLYKKLGFAEFARMKHEHPKASGINHLVYMKYVKQ